MASDRRKYVMSVELAMQREMAYRKRLELPQLKQGTEARKDPINQNQSPLLAPGYNSRPTSEAGRSPTPSPRPKISPHPSSSPSPGPKSALQRPFIDLNQSPVLSPSPRPPRYPSLPLKRTSSTQGPTNGPRLLARPTFPSGSNPAGRRVQPILPPRAKPGTGYVARPKLSPLGLIVSPKPVARPSFLSNPYESPRLQLISGPIYKRKEAPDQEVKPFGLIANPKPVARPSLLSSPYESPRLELTSSPIHKRKEAPDQEVQPDHGGKISKLCCEVCDVNCTSASNLRMHLKGQKHQAKVKKGLAKKGKQAGKIDADDPQFHCRLCEVWCMEEYNFKQHLSGKNHTRKLQAVQNKK